MHPVSLLDWLIVGGGVHGTYLSHALVARGRVPRERLRVLDPLQAPLAAFWRMTEATGMRYLRSPGVHNLGLHPFDLRRFARQGAGRRVARFSPPYERPGLPLFRAHTEHLIENQRLDLLRERGHATSLRRIEGGFRLETERGALDSRRVVLALGTSEQLQRPGWVIQNPRVQHLFEADFRREAITAAEVVVVGGGISAVQVACALVAQGVPGVTLLARHEPRVHRFDSDPEWLGPRGLAGFWRERDLAARRALIGRVRHRGSMSPEVFAELQGGLRKGKLRWVEAEATGMEEHEGKVRLRLDRAPWALEAGHVVLATGFSAGRPGGKLVEGAVEELGLPCAPCGFPRLPPSLAWAPGLFVTGALAELELGPSARNIAGARSAGERLLAA